MGLLKAGWVQLDLTEEEKADLRSGWERKGEPPLFPRCPSQVPPSSIRAGQGWCLPPQELPQYQQGLCPLPPQFTSCRATGAEWDRWGHTTPAVIQHTCILELMEQAFAVVFRCLRLHTCMRRHGCCWMRRRLWVCLYIPPGPRVGQITVQTWCPTPCQRG